MGRCVGPWVVWVRGVGGGVEHAKLWWRSAAQDFGMPRIGSTVHCTDIIKLNCVIVTLSTGDLLDLLSAAFLK